MESKTWRIEVLNACCSMEPSQNATDLRCVVGVQSPRVAGLEEPPQAAVFEADYHLRECNP